MDHHRRPISDRFLSFDLSFWLQFYKMKNLELDFVHTAETYGKIIIQEMCLPDDRKTLRPVSVGGVAGGAKYISNGILFKFAVDERNLYGGDQNAIKSASHDLKVLFYSLFALFLFSFQLTVGSIFFFVVSINRE